MGEQPHPWPLLQDRDGKSRHRTIDLLLPEVVDYISILFQLKRSRRLIARSYLIGSEEILSRYGVTAPLFISNLREDSFFR